MNRIELHMRLISLQLQLNQIVKMLEADTADTQEWTDHEPFLGQCTEKESQ